MNRLTALIRSGTAGFSGKLVAMLALRGGSLSLQFGTGILLARLLGVTEFGRYTYAISWILILGTFCVLGVDRLIIREIAGLQHRQNLAALKGLVRSAAGGTIILSLLVATISGLVLTSMWFALHEARSTLLTLLLALTLLPLMSLLSIQRAIVEGLRRPVLAQFPESVVQPILFVVLIGIFYVTIPELNSRLVIIGAIVAAALATFVGARQVIVVLPMALKAVKPSFLPRQWLLRLLPLAMIGGIDMIGRRTDVAMLGPIVGMEEAGIYAVASRAADLLLIVLAAAMAIVGPRIIPLHENGDQEGLQALLTYTTRITLLLTLLPTVALLAFGEPLLRIFGPDFVSGYAPLAILAAAQLVNVAMGPVATTLTMLHEDRHVIYGLTAATLANITLNSALIPLFGMIGAAAATAFSLLIWNVWLSLALYKKYGLTSHFLGRAQ